MTFHLITIFPNIFESFLSEGILSRAIMKNNIKIKVYNPRDFTEDKHKKVDDKPYGGGPGMVLKAMPILRAVNKAVGRKKKFKIIILSPRGEKFTNKKALELSRKYNDIILISGRYEGIDKRVLDILKAKYGFRRIDQISIGDYVLSGGEIASVVVMDAISRQIKGVLGKEESLEERRIASGDVYTRPPLIELKIKNKKRKFEVPQVLTSGHHGKIQQWKKGRNK